ncbi:ELWxxDGT repeat protein [Algibacter sp. 2305UL17-15]|uniref:ELWxxDGT repeat protein n=1 Tax=Algibacter sp. 2305UL17-15 TaxID=3231268 RepID=UPI0034592258
MKTNLLFLSIMTVMLTQAQVSLVKDINPSGDSNPKYFTEHNGILYFQAGNTGSGGNTELWRTDGTASGTALVKELRFSTSSSDPRNFKVYNNLLYFQANSSATNSNLYQSDGTSVGTTAFQSTATSINPYFIVRNGELYYARAIPGARALFKYDGSSELQLSVASGQTRYITAFNTANKVIFQSDGAVPTDYEIWESDGTTSGTQELADISYGNSAGSDAKDFFEVNGKIFFTAYGHAGVGRELYITDGTPSGTVLLKNINPTVTSTNADSSNPGNFTIFNNKLYFTANDASNGEELWMSDGTTAGTQMVIDLYAGATGSNPSNLFVFNNALYFAATNPALGREVFKCTTLNNVSLLKNIVPGANGGNPSDLIEYNGKLYFTADDGINGRELWSSTGFNSTTNMVADINVGAGSSSPDNFKVMGNNLYFSADDGVSGTGVELYKYLDPTLSLVDVEVESNISIFPNPTANYLEIKSNIDLTKVEVYSLHGQAIKSFVPQNQYDISDLSSGIYFVKIKANNNEIIKRIVKE